MLDVLIDKPESKYRKNKGVSIAGATDKPIKSFLKSVSWRIVGTVDTMLISYFITGKLTLAVSIGSIEVISKTILYYFHERIWAHIHKIRLNFVRKENQKRDEIKRIKRPDRRKTSRGIFEKAYTSVP